VGGAAVAWPLAAQAQDRTKRVIGVVAGASPEPAMPQTIAISDGLRDLGYVEGRNYEIVRMWAYGVMDRLPMLAEEMVRLKPDVIVAVPTPATVAVKAHTRSIPIVSFMIADEIRLGLVTSHSHPGGNVTGLLMRVEGMAGKLVELAVQTLPGATKIGIIFNPTSADASAQRQETESARATFGINIVYAEVRTPSEIGSAFQRLESERVQVAVVLFDGLFFQERKQIADLAAGLRLPVVYSARDHITAGGLISYGISLRANAYRMAAYIDKIFRGANAADLPLEFPTKLELVINLKAAKSLGLDISPTLLARADEVIE
jgi:putative ABC transport system substrate-binding protein